MKRQKKIQQAAQFLIISSLRNYQLYILNFAESKKIVGGDDLETKKRDFQGQRILMFDLNLLQSIWLLFTDAVNLT